MRDRLIELIGSTECGNGYCISEKYQDGFIARIADHLIANGVTIVKPKKQKPPVDLTGKCGSCVYAVQEAGHFGNSPCYVRCTNEEHLSRRPYQSPLVAVRQRTVKACKCYVPREG